MRAVCRVGLALGLVIVMAAPVLAQGQQKGRGGRGGFGGFGGPGLVNNKSVQQELKLTDEQIKKAADTVKEVREKHNEEFANLRNIEDMQERFQKMGELNRTVNTETYKALESVLKPEQMKRLKQIELQLRGNGAFGDEHVQKALKLTDEQKEKIKTINEDFRNEMREAGQANQGDREAFQKKMTELRKDAMDKISAVLTADQKKEWHEMVGEHFEVKFEPGQGGFGKKKRDQ
jgi:Spy/CpxP family protein refolding chaperone